MIQGILVVAGYLLISFLIDLGILGTIGHKMKNIDEKVGIPSEERGASPIFVTLSTVRVCGLIYLANLLYNRHLPVILFIAIAIMEFYRGISQMIMHDNMGRSDIRNYYTGKTIGSFIGLVLMAYWSYFI